ncbi:MAG: SelT/SelW/SelH family protein [Desulfobulbaceae bacterium]|nr:SelT/SelW/SelH family protein [Desulfobulbaceae bacterium]
MGAELLEQFGIKSEIIASSGGVFEVVVDGELLFSKKSLNRFPEDGEVVNLINSMSPLI